MIWAPRVGLGGRNKCECHMRYSASEHLALVGQSLWLYKGCTLGHNGLSNRRLGRGQANPVLTSDHLHDMWGV